MDPEQNNVEPTITANVTQDTAVTNTNDADVETTTSTDLEIKVQALEEVLKETKDQNKKLLEEMNTLKLANAKLISSLDISEEKVSFEDALNSMFNKRY